LPQQGIVARHKDRAVEEENGLYAGRAKACRLAHGGEGVTDGGDLAA